jgi:hypothetical protein
MRGVLPAVVVGIVALVALEFLKEGPGVPDAAALAAAGARVAAVEGIEALFAACPADIWSTRRDAPSLLAPTRKVWTEVSCQRDFDDCVTACVDRGGADACRQVARAIEVHGLPEVNMARRHANALACALGNPSGCTNRGAEIRNSWIAEETFSGGNGRRGARDLCLFRTFEIACAAENAWGCAMSGQAFQLGEGVAADADRAEVQYRRACALHLGPEEERSEYAPCRFARSGLATMGRE